METIPRGPGPQTYTGQGQVLPQGQGQGQVVAPAGPSSYGQPGAHGGQFRGAGDSIMVGRGMLADLRQLMQKVANATQQTAVAVQSQNPGMRLFRFLADFRYFQFKFHHFCESSKSGLKFYRGGGFVPETVFRCQLDNSGGVYDVC